VGLSLDFVYLNLVGFAFYTVYNAAFLWSPTIRDEYAKRHDGKGNLVQVNDLVFGLHATLITAFTLYQTFIYKRDSERNVAKVAITILPFVLVLFVILAILSAVGVVQWLDTFYYMGAVKVFISLCKYIPQLVLNYQRKSTIGWSIGNILLDFTGGILSIVQEILDAVIHDDFTGISGNFAKFLLGFVSVFFDVLFMIQHFILYRKPPLEEVDLDMGRGDAARPGDEAAVGGEDTPFPADGRRRYLVDSGETI